MKNHDVYEAVSEDENDGLMSNDDSKRRDSKKKKSTREDKPSSSEVPKRRVFYDSEDQPSEKEVPKDAKKPKKDREYEQVEEKTSRKRSSSPREKKSKRDDSSKRERERPASETSEEEKQKLRREKAKNFTERLRYDNSSSFIDLIAPKLFTYFCITNAGWSPMNFNTKTRIEFEKASRRNYTKNLIKLKRHKSKLKISSFCWSF